MSAVWLKRYGLALTVFLVLDAVWLGVVARTFYRQQIGFLLAESPNWYAAGVFYLLFIAGLVHFVVSPAAREGAPGRGTLRGAFFGLVTYATYDLTNMATVARWPLAVTLVDLAWGAAVAAATAYLCIRLGPRDG
ncbi:MAG: DUF2177 family protein [Acidobacteria bacterium]|nr:DUF2177 family protein [Acidobacteriota bacterium]